MILSKLAVAITTGIIAALSACHFASAESSDLESALEKASVAMASKDWTAAADLYRQTINSFSNQQPQKAIGSQFGAIYYHLGICEMKLKHWDAAVTSFDICYRDFPNSDPLASNNLFHKLALLKGGEAAMGAERWEQAILRFSKFLAQRDPQRDQFSQGAFHVNMAICHYKLGKLAEGNEHLEIAMRNKANFPTPSTGIIAGFQAFVIAALAAKDEQIILDFINKNRGELIPHPAESKDHTAVFMKLAGDALTSGAVQTAMALYPLVLDTGDTEIERIMLSATALIHEKFGNPRGAVAALALIKKNRTLNPPILPTAPPENFAAAMDLFEGRKYQDAQVAFATLSTTKHSSLAKFYELECLRKVSNSEAFCATFRSFQSFDALDPYRKQQFEIYRLWEAAHLKDWAELEILTAVESNKCLPAGQCAQVGYLRGLALHHLGRSDEAIDFFNIALVADTGASVEITRQAALRILEIHYADPDVISLISDAHLTTQLESSPSLWKLREAAAIAHLFELSLGGGNPLPASFREFLKYHKPPES